MHEDPAVQQGGRVVVAADHRRGHKRLVARQQLDLDEPCAGLDLYEREKFLEALTVFAGRNLTMLYVTHHIEEIVPFFTHVALMVSGRIAAQGPKRDVLTPEQLREAYDVPLAVDWADGRPWIRVGGAG